MQLLTEDDADRYIKLAGFEFFHAIDHAVVYIGQNPEGVKFVLLKDEHGHAVLTEAS